MAEGKKVIRRPRPEKMAEHLDPGDLVEFSLTVGIKVQGKDYWIKAGTTSSVRPHETGFQAQTRIEDFVQESINRKVLEILN